MKNEYFIIVAIISFLYVINVVKRGKFSINESILWLTGSCIIIILSLFPKMFDLLAIRLGIDYPPSLFFLICILFLLFINFRNSKKIAILEEKTIELSQQIALINSTYVKDNIKKEKNI